MSPLVIGALVLGIATVAGVAALAYGSGWRFAVGSPNNGASADRFKGAEGVTLIPGPEPDFWWTRVVTGVALVDPNYLPGVPASMSFTRVLIPTDLLFEPDSTSLEGASARALDLVANQIRDNSLEVVVVCHSSSDGPPASRQPLSLRRANSLADALERKLGKPADSIRRIGKGDSVKLPDVDPDSPTGRAMHRRCEVFVETR